MFEYKNIDIPIEIKRWEQIKDNALHYVLVTMKQHKNNFSQEEFIGFTLSKNLMKKIVIKPIENSDSVEVELNFYNFIEDNDTYVKTSFIAGRVFMKKL